VREVEKENEDTSIKSVKRKNRVSKYSESEEQKESKMGNKTEMPRKSKNLDEKLQKGFVIDQYNSKPLQTVHASPTAIKNSNIADGNIQRFSSFHIHNRD
jgi:hypothetical protein